MFRFSIRSMTVLDTVHSDLVEIMLQAIRTSTVDFVCYHGIRTIDEQKAFFAAGKSHTMNSRHLTGHAVDIAPIKSGVIDWSDIRSFDLLSECVKTAAEDVGINLEWGGDWATLVDMPHYQLSRAEYPDARADRVGFLPLAIDGTLSAMLSDQELPEFDHLRTLPSIGAAITRRAETDLGMDINAVPLSPPPPVPVQCAAPPPARPARRRRGFL